MCVFMREDQDHPCGSQPPVPLARGDVAKEPLEATLGGPPCTWQSRTRNDNSVQRTNGHSTCVAYFRSVSLIFYSSGVVFEHLGFAPCWEIFDACQFE